MTLFKLAKTFCSLNCFIIRFSYGFLSWLSISSRKALVPSYTQKRQVHTPVGVFWPFRPRCVHVVGAPTVHREACRCQAASYGAAPTGRVVSSLLHTSLTITMRILVLRQRSKPDYSFFDDVVCSRFIYHSSVSIVRGLLYIYQMINRLV